MARITYRGYNLPDGTEIPDVPADLQRLVDGIWSNSQQGRLLVLSQVTSTTGNFGTSDLVIPGLSIVLNAVAGRRYLIDFYAPTAGSVTNAGYVNVGIFAGATQIQFGRTTTAASVSSGSVIVRCIVQPGTATVTYTARANCLAGTANLAASAQAPIQLAAYDLGLVTLP